MLSKKSIAQKEKARYGRALALVEDGAVSPNGAIHQFYVQSQTGNGTRYLAATPEAFPAIGRCNCRDFVDFGRHNDVRCKHIIASQIYERAETHVREQARKHDLTWQRVIDLAFAQLACAKNDTVRMRYQIVIRTAERLIRSEDKADRKLCAMAPYPLDHIRRQIRGCQATSAELNSKLRHNPDDKVAAARLKINHNVLKNLNAQEQRIVRTWTEA